MKTTRKEIVSQALDKFVYEEGDKELEQRIVEGVNKKVGSVLDQFTTEEGDDTLEIPDGEAEQVRENVLGVVKETIRLVTS